MFLMRGLDRLAGNALPVRFFSSCVTRQAPTVAVVSFSLYQISYVIAMGIACVLSGVLMSPIFA